MTILWTLKNVFKKPAYFILAASTSIAVFVFSVLMPNLGLLLDSRISLPLKTKLVWSFLGGIATNFSLFSATYTILIALLFGVNLAMISFLLKKNRRSLAGVTASSASGGIVAGIFGVGCAACGSLVLSAFLPFVGASALLTFLPLRGGEFGILAVILLSVSLVVISKQIAGTGIRNAKIK